MRGWGGQRGRRAGAVTLVTGVLLATAACVAAPETAPGTLSRDSFVETYVALRVSGLRAPGQLIDPEDRARILEERGVTEEDLLAFAELHGGDVDYMQEVWDEIEERLEDLRTRPDSGSARS